MKMGPYSLVESCGEHFIERNGNHVENLGYLDSTAAIHKAMQRIFHYGRQQQAAVIRDALAYKVQG